MKRNADVRPQAAFEMKGSALTLMVLHLLDPDASAVSDQLADRFARGAGILRNAPVVIDLSALRPESAPLDFPLLLSALRTLEMVPVAARGGSEAQHRQALAAGLGILPEGRGGREESAEPAAPPEEVPASAAEPAGEANFPPAKVVPGPIRSGQRVVAPEGDLIVLSSVSPGAEILAGRNIHVYGALRGRALAGARGDAGARVFCLQFDPELVAVAGEYLVSEEIPEEHLGKTVQVCLRDEKLNIESLGAFSPK